LISVTKPQNLTKFFGLFLFFRKILKIIPKFQKIYLYQLILPLNPQNQLENRIFSVNKQV